MEASERQKIEDDFSDSKPQTVLISVMEADSTIPAIPSPADPGAPTWLFPCYPCGACPRAAELIFPVQLMVIQDYTHLVVLLGVISSVFLHADNIYVLIFGDAEGKRCNHYCIRELSFFVFLIPCTMYFIKLTMSYDKSLMQKQRLVQDEQLKLGHELEGQVDAMNQLLSRANDSAALLTERIFVSRVRDFQRFLDDSKRFDKYFDGCQIDTKRLVLQFRTFISQWLDVLKEWSIDPNNEPPMIAADGLESLGTVGEIAAVVDERLQAMEVSHISVKFELHRYQAERGGRKSIPTEGIENQTDIEAGQPGTSFARLRCACPWLMCFGRRCCGKRHDVDYENHTDETGYPKKYGFGCLNLTLLSQEHSALLGGFVFGLVVFLMFVVDVSCQNYRRQGEDILGIALTEFCIVVVLMRFEQLDEVQSLKREAARLKEERLRAQKRHEMMNTYWEAVQQMTDFWVHRTVPCLSLYKEVHEHLIRVEKDELLMLLAGANFELRELDTALGAMDLWRLDGELDMQKKKDISDALTKLCSERSLGDVLMKLPRVREHVRQCLLPTSPPRSSLQRGSSSWAPMSSSSSWVPVASII